MNERFNIFVIEKSKNRHVQLEVNAPSIEELDKIIANNFKNYEELSSYIIAKAKEFENNKNGRYDKTYQPYPRIKVISSDKNKPVKYLFPIFELIDKERILELCKDALSKREDYRYNRNEILIIQEVINDESITYEKLRECTFALKRLGYKNVTKRAIERNSEYDIEKYIKKPINKTKKRTNNLHFL